MGAPLARRGAAVGAVLAGASPSKNRDHRVAPACKGRDHQPGGTSFRFNGMLGGPAGAKRSPGADVRGPVDLAGHDSADVVSHPPITLLVGMIYRASLTLLVSIFVWPSLVCSTLPSIH